VPANKRTDRRIEVPVRLGKARCGHRALPAAGAGLLVLVSAGHGGAWPDEFALLPAVGFENASGHVQMRQPWSPFGVSITEDGRVLYDLAVVVRDLPPAGDDTYHVWVATKELAEVLHVGPVAGTDSVATTLDWSQFLVVVSLESGDPGARWSGPIVLRGHSPGALLQPLWGHSIFQQIPM
jgi:hypothetical protein